MDLYERLFPTDDSENIPIHAFEAAVVDYVAGETTRAQIVSAWSLDSEAQADLTILLDHIDTLVGAVDKLRFVQEWNAVNALAEAKLKYTTRSSYASRLGLT